MNLSCKGPLISISFIANELSNRAITIPLPDGYSYESILINRVRNIPSLFLDIDIHAGDHFTFPVVNSKSPSTLKLFIADLSKAAEIRVIIEEFGQIPDSSYFDKAFDPIPVTGDDGNNYTVIPSDQFK